VSYGERMSTRIFASYLRRCGVAARQFDAPALGIVTTDDFTNAVSAAREDGGVGSEPGPRWLDGHTCILCRQEHYKWLPAEGVGNVNAQATALNTRAERGLYEALAIQCALELVLELDEAAAR
jgi:hypothetical protein